MQSNATRITDKAAELRAAGSSTWPSMDEFIFLYGEAATSADCDDYLAACGYTEHDE